MEDMYGYHSISDYTISPETNLISPPSDQYHHHHHTSLDHYRSLYGSDELLSATASVISKSVSKPNDHDHENDEAIKAKIANHPLYPKLLDAFIDCQKVGYISFNLSFLAFYTRFLIFCIYVTFFFFWVFVCS